MYKRQATLSVAKRRFQDMIDELFSYTRKKIEQPASIVVKTDTVPPPAQDINKKIFIPNPTKATWLAVVFPGGGPVSYTHLMRDKRSI